MRTFQLSGPRGRWLALDLDLVRDALHAKDNQQGRDTATLQTLRSLRARANR